MARSTGRYVLIAIRLPAVLLPQSRASSCRGMLSKRTRTCGHCNGNRSPEHFSTVVCLVQEPGLRDGGKSPVSPLWLPQRGDRCKTTADDQDYFVRVSNILKPVCIAENRRCLLLTCPTKWRGGGDPASRNTLLLAGIHVCMIRCMPTCSTCSSSDLDRSKCAYSFFGILTKMIV